MTRRGEADARPRAPDVRRRLVVRREGALPGRCRARARTARGPHLGSRRRCADRAAPANRRRMLGRVGRRGTLLEGEDVWVTLEARPTSRVPPPAIVITERFSRLGVRETPLRRDGAMHRGTYVLERVPRGRYAVEEARATIDDPFGLARAEVELAAAGALLVYPRLVALDRLFSESGAHAQDGRRLLLRRPSGFDLHSVREYEQGESLRKVHWRTTARRGQLMVKELEDAPRDEIAVLLDADATAVQRRELRRPGARRGLDPARARGARPPGRARGQLGVAAERARLLARRRWLPRSGCSRMRSRTGRAPWSSSWRARAAPPRGRSRRWSSPRASRARSPRSSCSARWRVRASASSGSTRRASRAGRRSVEPELLRAPGGRRRRRRPPAAATPSPRCSAPRPQAGGRMARTLAVTSFPALLIALALASARGEAGRLGRTGSGSSCSRSHPRSRRSSGVRLALIVPAALVAMWVALDMPLDRRRPGFFEPVFLRFDDGFFDYYDVRVPFNGVEHAAHARRPRARDLRLLRRARAVRRRAEAVAGGADGDRRRRLAGDSLSVRRASSTAPLILAAALWVLAGLRGARPLPALVAGRVLVLAARRRLDLGRAREGRRARLGALGPERAVAAGLASATSGTRTTAGSSFRRRRRPSCASSGPSAASTGARRRSTSSTPTAGSRTRRRSRPASRPGACRATRSCRLAR